MTRDKAVATLVTRHSPLVTRRMTKIFLIRHAETEPTGDDATLWPLSERGESQVRELTAQPFWDEVKAIICSDEQKAVATVQSIAFEHGIPLYTRSCLRELARTPGIIGDYAARVQEVFAKPALSVGGWERAADAQARIVACIHGLIQEFDAAPFAIVSHGMLLALLLAAMQSELGNTFEIWKSLPFASVRLIKR